ncbi:MAG: aldo/keto reductase [Defluviitaleaceae bacterium]|nr:aldo/keto reductase [Defluviitaleaceae bacterium]
MKKIMLHNTDLHVSNICLGAGNFGSGLDEAQTFAILDSFAEAGGNFIDTANVYGKWNPGGNNGSEILIGRWLKTRNAYKTMVVATKGAHPLLETITPRVSIDAITQDLAESRQALGLDVIDFYWLHRDDENIPIEEIIDIMEDFIAAGAIRYYGASNFRLHRMETALDYCQKNNLQGFSGVQNQWALAAPDPATPRHGDPTMVQNDSTFYDWHIKTRIPAIPYSATAAGFFHKIHQMNPQIDNECGISSQEKQRLSQRVNLDYLTLRNLAIYKKLVRVSVELNTDIHQLSLAYFFNLPFDAIPITAVRNHEQLKGMIDASNVELPEGFVIKD